MTGNYRMRPAALKDWPGIVALDQEIFGAYGAQEEPAIIRSRLLTFPPGCAVLEGERGGGRPFIAGYLTTEKWGRAARTCTGRGPSAKPPAGRPRPLYHDAGGRSRLPESGTGRALAGPCRQYRAAGGLRADHSRNGPRRTLLSASPLSTGRRTHGKRDQDGDHAPGPDRSRFQWSVNCHSRPQSAAGYAGGDITTRCGLILKITRSSFPFIEAGMMLP